MAADIAAPEGFEPPALGEPYLLTPGPLTTAYSVKQAMLRDWGSWDGDFRPGPQARGRI
jgi:2-aminoethylphosphonate-pyruvate transaminase